MYSKLSIAAVFALISISTATELPASGHDQVTSSTTLNEVVIGELYGKYLKFRQWEIENGHTNDSSILTGPQYEAAYVVSYGRIPCILRNSSFHKYSEGFLDTSSYVYCCTPDSIFRVLLGGDKTGSDSLVFTESLRLLNYVLQYEETETFSELEVVRLLEFLYELRASSSINIHEIYPIVLGDVTTMWQALSAAILTQHDNDDTAGHLRRIAALNCFYDHIDDLLYEPQSLPISSPKYTTTSDGTEITICSVIGLNTHATTFRWDGKRFYLVGQEILDVGN